MKILPGFLLALAIAFAGQFLSTLIGVHWMGLPKSPVSAIMMAILLGIAVRNLLPLPAALDPGIRFGLVRVLRFGIVLLGIRLSLGEAGAIGLKSLPVIIGSAGAALLIVAHLARRMGMSGKLGTLIAVGTSICGATAIVATAPAIAAKDTEVSYAVACITLFGVIAMLVYPFAGHWIFHGDPFAAGLFLGTAVHETAQVAGAGLVYQEYYAEPAALDVATVAKLVRNLGMLVVIPLMCVLYHRRHSDGGERPAWYTMVPLFIVGFAAMSLLRTVGDLGDKPFGVMSVEQWQWFVAHTKDLAELSLGVAMAAVGLGTRLADLVAIGLKPLAVGLFSALLVGAVSVSLISLLY
ncbi:MAG: putative sulfate exporter family transporter [Gammaproteobacteria bacterium]